MDFDELPEDHAGLVELAQEMPQLGIPVVAPSRPAGEAPTPALLDRNRRDRNPLDQNRQGQISEQCASVVDHTSLVDGPLVGFSAHGR